MRKLLYLCGLGLVMAITSCSTTPAQLAERSQMLHKALEIATTASDSSMIYREIAAVESEARRIFTKQELKEYERLAHPQDTTQTID